MSDTSLRSLQAMNRERIQKGYEDYYKSILEDARKDGKLVEREIELIRVAVECRSTNVNTLAVKLRTTASKIQARYVKNPDLKHYIEMIDQAQLAYMDELEIAMIDAGDKTALNKRLSRLSKNIKRDRKDDEQPGLLKDYVK
ncbi:MAG: hypothetical protein ACYS80_10760 [Planctomycetota bacterium]|jgi:hypothetical protein